MFYCHTAKEKAHKFLLERRSEQQDFWNSQDIAVQCNRQAVGYGELPSGLSPPSVKSHRSALYAGLRPYSSTDNANLPALGSMEVLPRGAQVFPGDPSRQKYGLIRLPS